MASRLLRCVFVLMVATAATPAFADAVPDVTGLTTAEATTLLKQAGFQVDVQLRDGKPAHLVFAQEPPGYAVRPVGTTVVIKSGKPKSASSSKADAVPTFIGLSAANARERLKTWDGALEEQSVVMPALVGKVVHQWPPAGETVPPGDHLIVVIGIDKSPSARHKIVPTLEGQTVDAARKLVEAEGLSLTVEEVDAAGQHALVIAQFPLAGSLAQANDAVRVRVPRANDDTPAFATPDSDEPQATAPTGTAPAIAAATPTPTAPTLALPADQDVLRGPTVSFDWHTGSEPPVGQVLHFQIRIERQTEGGRWTHQATRTTTSPALRDIDFPRGRFRWSVRAQVGTHTGPWASPRDFYVYGSER